MMIHCLMRKEEHACCQYEAKVEIKKNNRVDVVLYNIETDIRSNHLHFWNKAREIQKCRQKLMENIMKDEKVMGCTIREDSFVRDIREF